MRSSIKQNKNTRIWVVSAVTSFVTNLSLRGQLHWRGRSGKFKAWFPGKKKAPELTFFGLNTFLDVIKIPKPQKPCWPYRHFKSRSMDTLRNVHLLLLIATQCLVELGCLPHQWHPSFRINTRYEHIHISLSFPFVGTLSCEQWPNNLGLFLSNVGRSVRINFI